MLASVVGAFVYLRIVVTMYGGGEKHRTKNGSRSTSPPEPRSRSPPAPSSLIGILPGTILDFARDATLLLVGAR